MIDAYDRFHLPAFDSHVYLAMAEDPAVFTVAPWGYRVLIPWIVHSLPQAPVLAYRLLCAGSLTLAGGMLFLFLRRVGHGRIGCLLAVAAFVASAPVEDVVKATFLADAFSVLVAVTLLLALEAGAGVLWLALLGLLLTLSKDVTVAYLFLPAVALGAAATADASGWRALVARARRGVPAALAYALPSLLAIVWLRLLWQPQIRPPQATFAHLAAAFASGLREQWSDTWPALLLAGLTPLALLGAAVPRARPFTLRHGGVVLAMYALSLCGWIAIPSPRPAPLFGANTLRLLLYALPLLLSLGLFALDALWPQVRSPLTLSLRTRGRALPGLFLGALLLFPPLAFDRYRRWPLHEVRDGPLALTFCRETLRTARALQAGREVAFELDLMHFTWGESDPAQMRRMRWFLRDGWGEQPHYGSGLPQMQEAKATLVLPSFATADLDVTLTLSAPLETRIDLNANGVPLEAECTLGKAPRSCVARVPRALLLRGDNRLDLHRHDPAAPGPSLLRLSLREAR